jgi:hypothetical protein
MDQSNLKDFDVVRDRLNGIRDGETDYDGNLLPPESTARSARSTKTSLVSYLSTWMHAARCSGLQRRSIWTKNAPS